MTNRTVSLDKELYRKAYEQYREWNEAELVERVRNAGQLSPSEAWQQYVGLIEFCWRLSPEQSAAQRAQKLADLERYYERVKQMEAWRRARGKAA